MTDIGGMNIPMMEFPVMDTHISPVVRIEEIMLRKFHIVGGKIKYMKNFKEVFSDIGTTINRVDKNLSASCIFLKLFNGTFKNFSVPKQLKIFKSLSTSIIMLQVVTGTNPTSIHNFR